MAAPVRSHRALPLTWITLAGAGLIVLFWTAWFTGLADLGQDHPARRAFEVAFPVADAVLAGTLIATGLLLARGKRAAAAFALVAAAAQTLFLGLLDATFSVIHGLHQPLSADAVVSAGIGLLCVAGGIGGLIAGWRLWRPA